MVATMKNILYGGYEGSDTEICENCESLGELLVKRLRAAGENTVLVRQGIESTFTDRTILIFFSSFFCDFVLDRLMELLVLKSVAMRFSRNPYIWPNIFKLHLASVWVM